MESQERERSLRSLLIAAGAAFSAADYAPRTTIFRQGDAADSTLYLETGRVWLAVTGRGGGEGICGLLDAGAFLGDETLAGRTERRHTAMTLRKTTVLRIATAQMAELLHADPAIADRFIAHVSARHAQLESDLADLLMNSVERRLARALFGLAHCAGPCDCRGELPDVPQAFIAEMVGTTRARVNVLMSSFKKRGLLRAEGHTLRIRPALSQLVEVSDSVGVEFAAR